MLGGATHEELGKKNSQTQNRKHTRAMSSESAGGRAIELKGEAGGAEKEAEESAGESEREAASSEAVGSRKKKRETARAGLKGNRHDTQAERG